MTLKQPDETDRARRYREGYTPTMDDPEATARVVTVLNGTNTRDEMSQMVMLYLMDPSYSRKDISFAVGYTERNKGWT